MTGDSEQNRHDPLIDRVVTRARLALAWEGFWPPLAAALAVVTLFLAVSWLGLWDVLPPYGRMAGVLAFAAALIASLLPLLRAAAPDRRAALSRVDRESGFAHRPATSLDDRLASVSGQDPMTRALWEAHRARMEAQAQGLRAGAPSPRLVERDPYALRFLVALAAVAAFAVAGSDQGARVLAAFDWTKPAAEAVPARIDAWVAPPAYTGRPPVFLTARPGQPAAAEPKADPAAAVVPEDAPREALRVPANSTLVARGSGGPVEVEMKGGAEPIASDAKLPEGVVERRFKLTGDAEARVVSPGAPDRVWRFSVIPDAPPSIALTGPLKLNARGTAAVAYEVKDDYGVAAAEARFTLKPEPDAPQPAFARPRKADATPARPLYETPKVALGLPRAKARDGKAETPIDVMEHPFAGAEAAMTLVARDEAGQEGKSAPLDMRLPARDFQKPLARALVEQRRVLARDAGAKPRVLQAIRALAMFPEEFTKEAGVYLGITTAFRRLEIALSDDELRSAADYLWEIALRIEDGDLPEAERDLRAAEEALRKALENGASEQEIKKLTENLRAALEKFMKEMAERQRQEGQQPQQAQRGQRGPKEVRPQDLRNMIDKMEKLSQSGAKDAAKQALADLRKMLDNLQNARRQPMDPNAQAQQQQLDKLQEMIREQGKLRDQTFQQYRQNERQQRNSRSQQRRQQGQEGEEKLRDLAQRQQQLKEQLDQMLREEGQEQPRQDQNRQRQGQQRQQQQRPGEQQGQQQQQPGGQQGEGQQQAEGEGEQEGQQALGEAGKSMGEAQGSLGKGETGQALDQQQKALEQLRKGAQALAQQMQGQGQPGQQGQEGEQGAQNGEEGRDDDPLGRPVRRRESDGDTTKVPGEIDAQRARRVLEELRKRLGEADRPREELDYLERLLAP